MKITEVKEKHILSKLNNPKSPVIYFLCKGDEIVYIGKSNNIWTRLNGHVRTKDFDEIYYFVGDSPQNTLRLEKYFIELCKPKLNKNGVIRGILTVPKQRADYYKRNRDEILNKVKLYDAKTSRLNNSIDIFAKDN